MTTRIITDSNGRKHITNEPMLHRNEVLERKAENARELGLNYEPVAWIKRSTKGNIVDLLSEPDDGAEPVYTASPQRTWIGLTYEDRFELAKAQHGWEDLLIAAEAKLKEKNG
jgi:hypothetical protein